jgi:large-conductance mechanosensitive channel
MSESIKVFVKENNVIGFAVAMISALAIKDLINAVIGNLLVPGLNTFLIGLQIKSFSKFLPGGEKIDGLPVIKALLTFIFTFMLLYFSITTFFQSWDKK